MTTSFNSALAHGTLKREFLGGFETYNLDNDDGPKRLLDYFGSVEAVEGLLFAIAHRGESILHGGDPAMLDVVERWTRVQPTQAVTSDELEVLYQQVRALKERAQEFAHKDGTKQAWDIAICLDSALYDLHGAFASAFLRERG